MASDLKDANFLLLEQNDIDSVSFGRVIADDANLIGRFSIVDTPSTFLECCSSYPYQCGVINADQFGQFAEEVMRHVTAHDLNFPIIMITSSTKLQRSWNRSLLGRINLVSSKHWDKSLIEKSIAECKFYTDVGKREKLYIDNIAAGRKLLALVGHELRVPLETLRHTQEMLGSCNMDERASELARQSSRVAAYMCDYIHNIVEFARNYDECDTTVNEEFCVEGLLEECLEVLSSHISIKELTVDYDIFPISGNRVKSDRKKLRQIFINLIGNSIRYTDEGNVYIEISTEDGLKIKIQDTGVGMSEQRLLEVFFSDDDQIVSASAGKHAGGLGIGVALCRKLVANLGGQLSVKSLVNAGTTVTLDFPAVEIGGSYPSSVNSLAVNEMVT